MRESTAPGEELFEVIFDPPEWGWLFFRVPSLLADRQFYGTHLEDPYPAMIEWLERISDGAESARWLVGEEGSVAQFIFVAAGDCGIDQVLAQLIVIIGDEKEGIWHFAHRPVTAQSLVSSFYGSFRAFAESERYDGAHWATFNAETEDGWEGQPLEHLRSQKIEAYLKCSSDQLVLFPRQSWE